jgi:hypothetical protein
MRIAIDGPHNNTIKALRFRRDQVRERPVNPASLHVSATELYLAALVGAQMEPLVTRIGASNSYAGES